jgi:uncharacterized membrane protein YkoI
MPDMFHALLMVATLAGLLVTATGEAAATRAAVTDAPVAYRAAAEGITLDDAVRKVRETYGDVTILKAESRGSNGGEVYRIKFLTESGRVKTVMVDATTGEFR